MSKLEFSQEQRRTEIKLFRYFLRFCGLSITVKDLHNNRSLAQCLKITQNVSFDIFKISSRLMIFGISNSILSTQNVYVARFARNIEWDFFCDFQTLCIFLCFKRSRKCRVTQKSLHIANINLDPQLYTTSSITEYKCGSSVIQQTENGQIQEARSVRR